VSDTRQTLGTGFKHQQHKQDWLLQWTVKTSNFDELFPFHGKNFDSSWHLSCDRLLLQSWREKNLYIVL
jgi:hypothetical protein